MLSSPVSITIKKSVVLALGFSRPTSRSLIFRRSLPALRGTIERLSV